MHSLRVVENNVVIDLSGIEAAALQLAGIVLIGILSLIGRTVLAKLHIELTAAQRDELEAIARRALSSAYASTIASSKSAGWDHLQVKNEVLGQAVLYAVHRFPDALKRAGISTTDPLAAGEQFGGMLLRLYHPVVAADAACTAQALDGSNLVRGKVGMAPMGTPLPRAAATTSQPPPPAPAPSPLPVTPQVGPPFPAFPFAKPAPDYQLTPSAAMRSTGALK